MVEVGIEEFDVEHGDFENAGNNSEISTEEANIDCTIPEKGKYSVEESPEEDNFPIKTKKLNSLEIDNKLYKVAEAHCKYLCTNGTSGHIGSEGSTLKNRIEKQKIKSKEYDECIVLGYNNPISIINCLVISRYSKNKKDRKILLNDKFKKVGIALGEHLCFGYCCVIVFSD